MFRVLLFLFFSAFSVLLASDMDVLAPEKVRHYPVEDHRLIPKSVEAVPGEWVLAVHYELGLDDRYLNWDEAKGVLEDEEGNATEKGWISVVDGNGNEWVQEGVATRNTDMIYAVLEDVEWRQEGHSENAVLKNGSDIDIRSVWIHRLYKNPALPESIYVNLYAGIDIVMGSDYAFDHFANRTVQLSVSADGPQISGLSIDGKEEGDGWESGDFVSAEPRIACTITDTDDQVASWELTLSKGESVIYTVSENITQANSYSLDHEVTETLNGAYLLTIDSLNGNNELGRKTATLVVETGVSIKNLLTGPLPCDFKSEGGLSIEYQLSTAADIDLRIYDIAGEMQKKWDIRSGNTGARQGFNRLTWDGVNQYGEPVANGPYVLYMKATNGDDTDTDKSKIVVLR